MRIALIFCTWKRVYRLQDTLNDLDSQTFKDFDIFIWNNNIKEVLNINNIIKNQNKLINVHHSKNNIGGIGRFYYAKMISNFYDIIIFIDDDQKLENDVVEKMISNFKIETISSWWGWSIKNQYWERNRILDFSEVDYCGTGGMILDSKIFNKIDLKKIPQKYKFIEDLWFSFVAKYEFEYKLQGGDFNITLVTDGNDQYSNLINLKNEFYNYLVETYR
jgi:hypothetical protein